MVKLLKDQPQSTLARKNIREVCFKADCSLTGKTREPIENFSNAKVLDTKAQYSYGSKCGAGEETAE